FGPDTLSRFYSIHMLLIPGGIATFIGIHLFLVTKLGIAEPPWSKRRLAIERAEEEERRRAARERLVHGRTPVPAGEPEAAPQPGAGPVSGPGTRRAPTGGTTRRRGPTASRSSRTPSTRT